MKVIVAGSRDIDDCGIVSEAISKSGFVFDELVSGGARGVDRCGESLAALHGMKCKVFPADWNKHGKSAGPIRNQEMGRYADALVAVWDGKSVGTKNMIDYMNLMKKPVYIHLVKEQNDDLPEV